MQDRRWNERAKWWIFCEIAKWRRWRHAPRLTATAVIMDSCPRFSKRWHVADVKNIAGDDQTTLMVHRISANIVCPFCIYVCLRLRDRYCCSAADGSCHAPTPSYFEENTRCRRKILDLRWPGNPNGRSKFHNIGLFTFTRSQLTLRRRLRGFWRSLKRHVTDVKDIAGMTRIDRNFANTKMYAYEIKQNVSKNFFFLFLLQQMPPWLKAFRTVFFFMLSLPTAFAFTLKKIISQRPWPHRKTEIYIL